MKLIEENLHAIHADTRHRREAGSGGGGGGREDTLPTPFAKVSQISEGSPSAIAVSLMLRYSLREGKKLSLSLSLSLVGFEGWRQDRRVWLCDSCQLHWDEERC